MLVDVARSSTTFLDALIDALRSASAYNRQDQTPPAAVLWTDRDRQWEPLLPALRAHLPLYVLGPYEPDQRTGPAYWLRCITERTLEDVPPPGETPVLYLPGYSRQDVRAIESCPHALQPLAELQYRGVLWTQKNGRDWTLAAFLQSSDGGLGINVAADTFTRAALQNALLHLAEEPVAALQHEGTIRAPYLNALVHPDDVKNILLWLNNPDAFQAKLTAAEWAAFTALSESRYGFDPERDGPVVAARFLAERNGNWSVAWKRFAEAPARYNAIPERLGEAHPANESPLFENGAYPQHNEKAETSLRGKLLRLEGVELAAARAQILDLEQDHGGRREWVWTTLNRAPLATALEPLARLATRLADETIPASDSVIAAYANGGWQMDALVLEALAAVSSDADVKAVTCAIRALYADLLDRWASSLQRRLQVGALTPEELGAVPPVTAGTCVLFSDGLRLDLGQRLAGKIRGRDFKCDVGHCFSALPSVTPTAKPAISPAASVLASGPELAPRYDGTEVNVNVLRRALTDMGYQVLPPNELGDPTGRAWTELGDIDSYGHGHDWKVAHHVVGELEGLQERIEALLEHGWKQVIVVTDHGWLLLPGGLPKADLPEHLTQVRKPRCARLKPSSATEALTLPWRWDPAATFAYPPGSACFEAGHEYEHGGISPQECVTPVLVVSRATPAVTATLGSVQWRGLRCQVSVNNPVPGLTADLRTRANDAGSSLVIGGAKPVREDNGTVSLPANDEDVELVAMVVLLDATGRVIAHQSTTVGG